MQLDKHFFSAAVWTRGHINTRVAQNEKISGMCTSQARWLNFWESLRSHAFWHGSPMGYMGKIANPLGNLQSCGKFSSQSRGRLLAQVGTSFYAERTTFVKWPFPYIGGYGILRGPIGTPKIHKIKKKKSNLTLKRAHLPVIKMTCWLNSEKAIGNCHEIPALLPSLKSDLVSFCPVWILVKSEFWSSHERTDRQTDSDAYEPTVHTHRCAQKSHCTIGPTMNPKPPREVTFPKYFLILSHANKCKMNSTQFCWNGSF